MSLELPLYLHNNLNQAPGLALNAVVPYAQSIHCLKRKLQNTFNVVYPILRHPRSSTISAILFSTRYIANLTGMASIYRKTCYLLSRRAGRIAFVENQLLVKLKELSTYCEQLNTRSIPWQRVPELQALEALREELINSQSLANPDIEIAEALSCCDEIRGLVTRHHSIRTEELSPEEIRTIEENAAIDTIFSGIEENTGEALGGYVPSLLAPILNDVLDAIPKPYNPLALVSSSLMTSLKKISVTVGSSSVLTVTSSSYFVSSHAQKTLLQLCAVSGMSVLGLYYQEQMEEAGKELLQTFLEIICAYGGMLLFKTDESFKGYFHKIVPATAASKATEYYLGSAESSTIASFALPLLVSSLVYNQDSIQENYQQLKRLAIHVLTGEGRRQYLQLAASTITDQVINSSSNGLNRLAVTRTVEQICSSELRMLAYTVLWANPHVGNQLLNNLFTPLLYPLVQQLLSQPTEQKTLQALNFSVDKSLMLLKEYLTILQQDDMQELILRIQQKLKALDPEAEELKNDFLNKVFLKKTGTPLLLNNSMLDLLKKSSGVDIQAILFTSFKNTPAAIRMLWNSYPYHKKVNQTLMLELLLQGFIITGLASLVPGSGANELPSFSYIKAANLTRNLVL